MLIKGGKYACDACIRGHRVSACKHRGRFLIQTVDVEMLDLYTDLSYTDRPLTHINKKGRPVSQCPHCRGLRKTRATHVECECGEKPHTKTECAHADKYAAKNWLRWVFIS
jgi:hypothetical protein